MFDLFDELFIALEKRCPYILKVNFGSSVTPLVEKPCLLWLPDRNIWIQGHHQRSQGVRFILSFGFTLHPLCLSFKGNQPWLTWVTIFFTLSLATNSLLKLPYLKKRWYFICHIQIVSSKADANIWKQTTICFCYNL